MFLKILDQAWFTKTPLKDQKCFGPVTISEFYHAMVNVKSGHINSEIEQWIVSVDFFKTFPLELVLRQTEESFVRILESYNSGTNSFLTNNPNFYLWAHP